MSRPKSLDRDREIRRVSLDSRENLDSVKKLFSTIEISRFCLDNNVQTKKSRSRSRNSSRSEIFGVSRQFVSISTEKCVDFCIFSLRFLNPSRLKASTISRFLDKSRLRLDKSQKSRQKSWRVSTILTKISTRQSLDWKISILKISTEKKKSWSRPSRKSRQFKKVSLDTKDVLDLDLDWSRLSRPPTLVLSFLVFKSF